MRLVFNNSMEDIEWLNIRGLNQSSILSARPQFFISTLLLKH